MNSVKYLINYQIEYYKKGSIIKLNDGLKYINFYLPILNKSIIYDSYNDKKYNYLIDNSLQYLGGASSSIYGDESGDESGEIPCFLVLGDIVIFSLNSHFNMGNNSSPMDIDEIECNYIPTLFEEIKFNSRYLNEFDKLGVCSFNVNCIIEEHWSQSMDDWDCYTEYVGMIRDDIDPMLLITDRRREEIKLENEDRYNDSDMDDFLRLYSNM